MTREELELECAIMKNHAEIKRLAAAIEVENDQRERKKHLKNFLKPNTRSVIKKGAYKKEIQNNKHNMDIHSANYFYIDGNSHLEKILL